MTANNPNGGPAFPGGAYYQHPQDGMSLRDWFAGQALAAIISGTLASDCDYPDRNNTAARAYLYADAMLAEREKYE